MAAGQEVKAREVSGSAPDIPNDRKEAIEERKHLHCVVEHQSRQHDDYEVADVSGEHWQVYESINLCVHNNMLQDGT